MCVVIVRLPEWCLSPSDLSSFVQVSLARTWCTGALHHWGYSDVYIVTVGQRGVRKKKRGNALKMYQYLYAALYDGVALGWLSLFDRFIDRRVSGGKREFRMTCSRVKPTRVHTWHFWRVAESYHLVILTWPAPNKSPSQSKVLRKPHRLHDCILFPTLL